MALSIEEMELEAVEFVPAREVMCGGCGGGGSYQSHNFYGNDNGNDNGNGSCGVLDGTLDDNFSGDTANIFL